MGKPKTTDTPKRPGGCRIFACLRFPKLVIGKAIRFEDGFFVSRSPEEMQRITDRSDQHVIRDITAALRGEMPLTKAKKVYLSSDPSLVIEHHVCFCDLKTGLGIYSSDNPDRLWLIARSPLLKVGTVREVPQRILQLVAELAESETLKAAVGA